MSDILRNVHAKILPSVLHFDPGLSNLKGYAGTPSSVAGDIVASFLTREALVAWSRTEKAKHILNEQVKTSGKGFGHLEGAYNQENEIVDGVLVINKDYTWPKLSNKQRAKLRKVVILAGVTNIGYKAFYKCTGLSSVDLTSAIHLKTIARFAFCKCTGLTSLTFPVGLTTIEFKAFQRCTGLTSVDLLRTKLTTIVWRAFEGCTGLTSFTFPAGLKTIQGRAFRGCSGLTSIDLSQTKLTTIAFNTFEGCTGLTSFTFPAGLKTIQGRAFKWCTGLTEVIFPAGLETIQLWAFVECTGLSSVDLTSAIHLKIIGGGAFHDCTNLKKVKLPASLKCINNEPFAKVRDKAVHEKNVECQQLKNILDKAFPEKCLVTMCV